MRSHARGNATWERQDWRGPFEEKATGWSLSRARAAGARFENRRSTLGTQGRKGGHLSEPHRRD
jgi:hypothetical protein